MTWLSEKMNEHALTGRVRFLPETSYGRFPVTD